MSRTVGKCVNAIYNVTSYSYFREGLTDDTPLTSCTRDPMENGIGQFYWRWIKVKLPPVAQNVFLEMIQHVDEQAFKRWNSMLGPEQVKRLTDKYDYGAKVSRTSTTRRPSQPSVAPEIERPPPSEAASSSHQQRQEAQRQDPKGKGKDKNKGGKSSKILKVPNLLGNEASATIQVGAPMTQRSMMSSAHQGRC